MILLRFFGQQRIAWIVGLFGLGLSACRSPELEKYPYLVKVRIEGCQGGVGRLFRPKALGIDLVDSAKLEQGQLVFRGEIEHPGVYKVFCHCENKVTSNVDVYLPADSVDVAVTPGENLRPDIYQPAGLEPIEVGSYLRNARLFSTAPQQRELAAYLLTQDSMSNQYFLDKNRLKAKMNAAIGAGNKVEIDRWADSTRYVQERGFMYDVAASERYIRRHPRSEIGLFALLNVYSNTATAKRLAPLYQAMPAAWQNSFFGKAAASRLHLSVMPAEAK
jgi:hypothetical protein